MNSVSSNRLRRTPENLKQARILLAHFTAAQATADWLCGGSPWAIHSYPYADEDRSDVKNGVRGAQYAELSTELEPYVITEGLPGFTADALRARAMNRAFVALSGPAAIYAHEFDRRLFPNIQEFLRISITNAFSILRPHCSIANEAEKVVFALWDGMLTIFRDPRVLVCIDELAATVVELHTIDNEDDSLDDHFDRHLSGLRVQNVWCESCDPVFTWPVRGIGKFTNPNWGTELIIMRISLDRFSHGQSLGKARISIPNWIGVGSLLKWLRRTDRSLFQPNVSGVGADDARQFQSEGR